MPATAVQAPLPTMQTLQSRTDRAAYLAQKVQTWTKAAERHASRREFVLERTARAMADGYRAQLEAR